MPEFVNKSDVLKKVKEWKTILDLSGWEIVTTVRESHEQDSDDPSDAYAYISVEEGYHQAELTVNAYKIERSSLDTVIAHELVHVILSPLATATRCALGDRFEPMSDNLTEAATDVISKALAKLYAKRGKKK